MRSSLNFQSILVCIFSLISVVLFVPDRSAAQERKGGISGRVTDNSGGVLQGAQIELEQKNKSLASNGQGEFFINDLDPGNYALTVTYVGFTPFRTEVNVVAGQTANVEVKLEVESQNLEVLVTAERAYGEAEAVNRERSADNILQVLPADVLRSLPNANMADALGRLPSVTIERDEGEGKYVQIRGTEPRLANVTIDGVNVPSPESGIRQIKLDTIPADLVESVEINKTLQANMDADGIGGSVNLVTKSAGERPTVSFSGMGGYTSITGGRGVVETTGTVGQRFGANKRVGVLIGGSYDWNGRGIDDIEPVPDLATVNGQQVRVFDSIDVREYRYYRSRWGFAGSADYKLAEGSSIYIRGLYSDFKNFGDRWVYSLTAGDVPSYGTQIRRPDYAIGSVVLGGKHVLTTTWYAWDVSASRSRQTGSVGDRSASFDSTLASSNCQYDLANTKSLYLPQWTPACFSEAFDAASFTLSKIQINHGLTAQLNLQFAGAMGKNYHVGSHLATIEIGGKFRNAHKFDNTFRDVLKPAGNDIFLSDLPSRFSNTNYYDGVYKLAPINPSFADAFTALKATGPFNTTSDSFDADFNLIEKVSAGYVMNTINFSRVRIVAGVRFEGTNLDTRTPTLDADGNVTGSFNAGGSYVKVLPSASVRFALRSDTNLRLAYSRGMSRPDPQNIAQAVTVDNTANPTAVSLGNPNLKAETANNFDVLVEHYLNPFGVIQAGFFYKDLSDPIVERTATEPFEQFPVARVTQPINAGSAWVSGFEAAYLQHLTFLPGPLRSLGISANYGYTASRANLGPDFPRSDHPRLVRSAPHTWNVSPTYDRGRFSVRIGLSYNAANIASYQFQDGVLGGIKGPFGDNYFYPHLQFDAQGSVRLAHGLTFIMYGLNINNEVFGFYFGSPQFMVQREYYKPTIAAGFRWTPLHEK